MSKENQAAPCAADAGKHPYHETNRYQRSVDARKLVKLLHHIRSKVNLIPFNEHPGSRFERPSPEAIDEFQQILLDANMTVIIRHSKGQDIGAACGQLRGRKTPA